ncbi:MAG: hypothetical protein IKT56_01035 [Clostridia bacterium]|nr:hypothetical protein [Clostridia bacterium]
MITTIDRENTTSEEMNKAITEFEKKAQRVEPRTYGEIYSFTYYQVTSKRGNAGFVKEYTIYNDYTYSDVIMDAYCDEEAGY